MGPIFVYSTIAFAGIAGLINPKWGLGAYLFLLYLQPEWNWRCVRQHHVNAMHAGRPLHEGLVAVAVHCMETGTEIAGEFC